MTERSTSSHLETTPPEGCDPDMKQVYVPAIKMKGGNVVFISGVTAAPPYHHHPHRPEEFKAIPRDIEGQVELLFQHLDLALEAAGCRRSDIVVMNRFFTN